MKARSRTISSLAAVASLLLPLSLWGTAAGADEPGQGEPLQVAQAGDEDERRARKTPGIEEIFVTSRKREERSQDIPVAVTTLSERELDTYDLVNLEDVAASNPQLIIVRGNSGSSAEITLRGIGSTFTSIGIEQSVAVNLDGVYYGAGRVINEGFFDVKQIEILKGPQALFFGKNSPAGVISITSNDPGESFEMLGRFGYEVEAEEIRTEGIISGPITDTLGGRLAVRFTKMYDGYVENEAGPSVYTTTDAADFSVTPHKARAPHNRDHPDQEQILARATLLWEPLDDLTIRLKGSGNHYETTSSVWNNEIYDCPLGVSQVNAAETCDKDWKVRHNHFPLVLTENNPLTDNRGGALFQEYESWAGTAIADYTLDSVSLTTVVGYHWLRNQWGGDYDYTGQASVFAGEDTDYWEFSAEARALTTFDGPFNFMGGLYYQRTERDFEQDVIFAGSENSAAADPHYTYVSYAKDSETDGETLSAFTQVLWEFLPDWELSGGARYTYETKDSFFLQPYVNPFLTGLFTPDVTVGLKQRWTNWSPEATLTWKPVDTMTLYAAYKQGYKSGGFSNSGILGAISGSVTDFAFDPEDVEGFELGYKALFFENTLRVDLIGYFYEYEDLQVDFFNSATFAFITTNAAEAEMKGVELEASYAPPWVEGLELRGTLAYNKTEYEDYVAPCYSGQTAADGCSPGTTFFAEQDIGGEPTARAPEWVASLGFDYERSIGWGLLFGMSGNGRYSDEYLTSPNAIPGHEQDDFVMLDAALRIGNEEETWQVALIGRNLTNKYVITRSGDAPLSGTNPLVEPAVRGDKQASMLMPRTVQIQLTLRY